MALLGEGESIEDLLKMGPEQILLRWVNYQLEKAGCTERVKNFSEDIKDSKVYTNLLAQVAPKEAKVNKLALQESDLYKRAEKTLDEAEKIGNFFFLVLFLHSVKSHSVEKQEICSNYF